MVKSGFRVNSNSEVLSFRISSNSESLKQHEWNREMFDEPAAIAEPFPKSGQVVASDLLANAVHFVPEQPKVVSPNRALSSVKQSSISF